MSPGHYLLKMSMGKWQTCNTPLEITRTPPATGNQQSPACIPGKPRGTPSHQEEKVLHKKSPINRTYKMQHNRKRIKYDVGQKPCQPFFFVSTEIPGLLTLLTR